MISPARCAVQCAPHICQRPSGYRGPPDVFYDFHPAIFSLRLFRPQAQSLPPAIDSHPRLVTSTASASRSRSRGTSVDSIPPYYPVSVSPRLPQSTYATPRRCLCRHPPRHQQAHYCTTLTVCAPNINPCATPYFTTHGVYSSNVWVPVARGAPSCCWTPPPHYNSHGSTLTSRPPRYPLPYQQH